MLDPVCNLLGIIKYEKGKKESGDESTPWFSTKMFEGGEIKRLRTSVSDINSWKIQVQS